MSVTDKSINITIGSKALNAIRDQLTELVGQVKRVADQRGKSLEMESRRLKIMENTDSRLSKMKPPTDTPHACCGNCDGLRTALQFYADKDNYTAEGVPGNLVGAAGHDEWEDDLGNIARSALAASPCQPDARAENLADTLNDIAGLPCTSDEGSQGCVCPSCLATSTLDDYRKEAGHE